MLSKIGFHPFLFSALPILFLFSYNIHEIRLEHIILPILGSAGIVFLIWFVLRFLVGNNKSSLLISWFLILFIVHGNLHIFLLTHDDEILKTIGKNLVLGTMFFAVFVLGLIYLIKSKSITEKTSIANIMSVTIVGFLIINIAVYYVTNPVDLTASKYADLPLIITDVEKKPDVYLFILDEYSGRETLQIDFNYNLTNFENELKNRGLLVPKKSYSNYPHTLFSVTSLLNMKYLDFLSEQVEADSKDTRLVKKIWDQNNVMKIFKKNGYRITSFYGGVGAAGDALLVDRKLCSFSYGGLDSDLQANLVNTYIPISYFNEILLQRYNYEKFDCIFSTIMNPEKDVQRPDYFHIHLQLPHAPYIYNEKGERVFLPDSHDMVISDRKDAYLAQLIFVNTKMLELIDSIQSHSPDAVIIITSDHGFRPAINWEDPTNIDFRQGFNVINAFYFPGKEVILPTEISSVNIFRILFNEYFNANYDILENKQKWHTADKLFDTIEVSDDFKK